MSPGTASLREGATLEGTHHSIMHLDRDGLSQISTNAGTKSDSNVTKKRLTCTSMHLSAS